MKYIPQAPPFVMIDELLFADERQAQTRFTIPAGHLFVIQNVFTEPGLVENMAQTAAAGTGKQAADLGLSAPVGFIGQVKNLHIYQLPEVGETITSTVIHTARVMNALVAEGSIRCNGVVIARAEFKVFLQES